MQALFAKARVQGGPLVGLSAGVKLIITAVAAVLALAVSGIAGQTVLLLASTLYAALMKRYKLLLGLFAAMAVMAIVALGLAVALDAVLPGMGGNKTSGLLIPFMRGISMMNTVFVLALTTKVQDLLNTLERWHCPFWIFFPISVMLRFIPTFFHDIEQVWETLKIRGWPMGARMMLLHPLMSMRLLFVPVLFRALKTSEVLGVSAELKGVGVGYHAAKRSATRVARADRWALLGVAATVALVVVGEITLAPYLPAVTRAMS